MEKLVCKKCGLVDDYKTEKKGMHLYAYCNGCDSFLKFVPQGEPRFYFGKYKKEKLKISECDDLEYLKWVHKNVRLKTRHREAVERQIDKLECYKHIGDEYRKRLD